jgi:D-3-phosphoglycerate dehydrogenase / 2-oxoglutarate reductase
MVNQERKMAGVPQGMVDRFEEYKTKWGTQGMTYKVLVSDSLAQEGLDILRSNPELEVDDKPKLPAEELLKIIGDYDALVIRSGTNVTKEVFEQAKKLKVIGRAGVGLDNVDIDIANQKGVIVMNTPGGNTISTAEHAWTLLCSLARNIPPANQSLKEGRWDRKKYTGTELFGKVIGVVGLGRIGGTVGSRALAFGMKVLGYDPFTSEDRIKQMGFVPATLDDIYAESDFITVHTPKTKETTHLINDHTIAKMKKGVRIINCARGGIVDENALLRGLESGKIAGAAIDVYEEEPPSMDNPLILREDCICTPHLGASTEEAQINVAKDIAQNVMDALMGGEVRNAVNIPSVAPEARAVLGPYLPLAEKLGLFAIQYMGKHLDKVEVKYSGPISEKDTSYLTVAVLKGILTPMMTESVNFVNAPFIAEKRHITYTETKTPKGDNYTNLISVKVTSGTESVEVCGTNFGDKDSRIVTVDGVHIDAKPFGVILYLINEDKPGVVGHIGVTLGKGNVNIADLTLGRRERGGVAITVCNLDMPVSDDVLKELKSYDAVKEIKVIDLQ